MPGFGSIFAKAWSVCSDRLRRDSERIGHFFTHHIVKLIVCWIALVVLGGTARLVLLVTAHPGAATLNHIAPLGLGYLAAALAPLTGYWLVQKSYPNGLAHAQPRIRLARLGTWAPLDPHEARQSEYFGLGGLVVSVVGGLLLALTMRLVEYFMAVPAIPNGISDWATAYFWLMTADLVFLSFLYSVAIAMALNAVPAFPRLLVYAWLCDVLMQLAIARAIVGAGPLPAELVTPLQTFLALNIKKVLVSATLWLPYLLLSTRINTTFRCRARVQDAALLRFA